MTFCPGVRRLLAPRYPKPPMRLALERPGVPVLVGVLLEAEAAAPSPQLPERAGRALGEVDTAGRDHKPGRFGPAIALLVPSGALARGKHQRATGHAALRPTRPGHHLGVPAGRECMAVEPALAAEEHLEYPS